MKTKQILLPSQIIVDVIRIVLMSKRHQLTEHRLVGLYTLEQIMAGDQQLEECLEWLEQFKEIQDDTD